MDKNKYLKELTFDLPIEYKGLKIYPVQMKDYIDFHLSVNCLLLDKNSIPSVEIISMSYLRFLYYISVEQDMPYIYMLKLLLCIVLHMNMSDDIKFYVNDSNKAFFKINGDEYSASDFDCIADIILEQNCVDRIDETIQKEIRDDLQKAEEYKAMQSKSKVCSLEEQMICVLISTALNFEDISNLTIRKFSKILQRVDAKLHYEIYLSASMSGFVKFKDDSAIKHWMSDLSTNDKYANVKVDMNEMRDKINNINQ